MTRLPVRFALLVVCLAAIGTAAYVNWSTEHRTLLRDASSRHFDSTASAAAASFVEMRAAQQAYVATGQGADFWFARVGAIKSDLGEKLAMLKSEAATPDASAAIDNATSALQDFDRMDRRAQDYTRGRQLVLASDLVFADGLELTAKAADALERARVADLTDRDVTMANLRRGQALASAGAAGLALLAVVLLVGRPKSPAAAMEPATAETTMVTTQTLDDLQDFGSIAPAAPAAAPLVDLHAMASLCGDLARLADTAALPAILERASAVLDASGIILWIADPDGRELSPIVVHGYPPQLATRIGNLSKDAENVTASAYRTGLLQTMKGDAISNGAIAVPLVSAGGCVGVMAAEVKNGGERQAALLDAAAIIASQLATLVGPPSVRAKAEAAG